jgi:hypothetical protein
MKLRPSFDMDAQGRKLVTNALAGLNRLNGQVGNDWSRCGMESRGDSAKGGMEVQIEHQMAWDGTGRAQYALACHRLDVRPNPSVIHQLGRPSVVVDIGPLSMARHSGLQSRPTKFHVQSHKKCVMDQELLSATGAAILEALQNNSLATYLR